MIALIKALMSNDLGKKHSQYKKAIKNLEHIKYYHVESIYAYCKFLKDEEDENFDKYLKIGIQVSKKYNFWYQNFKLKKLLDENLVYNEEAVFKKLPGIEKPTFDLFIEQYKIENKNVRKKR